MPQETDAEKIARLEREIQQLKAENESLRRENERLRRLLEEALRAGKRQAAPFSRRHPKAHPAQPGRKPQFTEPIREPLRSWLKQQPDLTGATGTVGTGAGSQQRRSSRRKANASRSHRERRGATSTRAGRRCRPICRASSG